MNPQAVAEHISNRNSESITEDKETKFREFIKHIIDKGARCQLKYAGITGQLYIGIGMYDPEKFKVKDFKLPENHPPYLPAVPPVLIENIMGTFQEALEHVAEIDINKMVKDIENTMHNVNITLNEINKGIKDAQIDKISHSMNDFLITSKDTVKEIAELRRNVENTLENADDLMNTTENLIEYLKEHPESLIYGRQDQPVIEP